MIKEILQENINKSLSKEKFGHKNSKSFFDGLDIFKKLNIQKNQSMNLHSKKETN